MGVKRLSLLPKRTLWLFGLMVLLANGGVAYGEEMSQGCNSYTELKDADRQVSYGSGGACDNSLSAGWYRFKGLAGSYMPESCPDRTDICGTTNPGWLNGIHPTAEEGVVTRTVCFCSGATSCCNWRSTIEVQNCGNFYIYKLVPSPSCNLRYCGTDVVPSIPAECIGYKVLNETTRYWSYDDGSSNCDNTIVSNKWYRFTGDAGTMMAPYCIPHSTCNTDKAGWISGAHPTDAYELVTVSACMHYTSNCCENSYPVEIRNCSAFYVYKLQPVSGCNQRYCGVNDENDACPANPGTAQCECPTGYSGLPCQDVDECQDNTHNCDVNAQCNNTFGSFNCTCLQGYSGDGLNCSDVDECENGTHNCDVNAQCNNTIGSFNCTCLQGYLGDGLNCSDVDECENGTPNCDVNGQCNNTIGSFNCTCLQGYLGDGVNCSDVDECQDNTHNCDVNAQCNNTFGSFNCTCLQGYSGDGVDCSDIDECATATHNCHGVAKCYNNPGSFSCKCRNDYVGDGVICEPVEIPSPFNSKLILYVAIPGGLIILIALIVVIIFCVRKHPIVGKRSATRNSAADDNMAHNNPTYGSAENNQGIEPEYMEIWEFQNVDLSDPHYHSLDTAHGRSEPAFYAGLNFSQSEFSQSEL